ncbi:hypothetical protein E4T56_gene730 [Termitomyces sp. T112]|nr:hypothetical protein E4T56_gene730 [Termitomyces sp. T112]
MPRDDQPVLSPDAPELQPQVPSVAQSNDATVSGMLNMLHAFAALANQSPGLAPSLTSGIQAAPPAAFPAFMSTDQSPASKSLPALFPAIETSMLLDIAHHEFCPMDLYANSLWITGSKDYPAFHNLLIPLSTYFLVLQAFEALSDDAHATFLIGHGGASSAVPHPLPP